MSSNTTIPEINEAIKALKAGVRQAVKAMTDLSVDNSKLESKLGKTETKLELAKAKATVKKGAATTASNSAAASASESSSVGSTGPLTATAAKELPAVQQLIGMLAQLDELTVLVKGLPKPGKVKSVAAVAAATAEPKGPTNAHIAWQPATLYPDEWAAFKAECQPAKDTIKEQIAALDPSDPAVAELKTRQRQIGSVMAFNALCREVSHKAEWAAFQAEWAVEHPKKAMGGGGGM